MRNEIISIKRTTGIAGQFAYDVKVKHENGTVRNVGFVGNTFSSAVYMIQADGEQTRVIEPSRFGPVLNPEWIRNFFA